ncbi:MAG: hypothetical protein ACKPAJ_02610, partial [Actinomycetota bacterium]
RNPEVARLVPGLQAIKDPSKVTNPGESRPMDLSVRSVKPASANFFLRYATRCRGVGAESSWLEIDESNSIVIG